MLCCLFFLAPTIRDWHWTTDCSLKVSWLADLVTRSDTSHNCWLRVSRAGKAVQTTQESLSTWKESIIALWIFSGFWSLSPFSLPDFVWTSEDWARWKVTKPTSRLQSPCCHCSSVVSLCWQLTCCLAVNRSHRAATAQRNVHWQWELLRLDVWHRGSPCLCLRAPTLLACSRVKTCCFRGVKSLVGSFFNVTSQNDCTLQYYAWCFPHFPQAYTRP